MAQTRKQQSEIERVLKRVADGLIEFESIWQKVYSASTASLKEKHEADLKKEIKRLQRYRDQIKTWLSAPEIRDKEEMLTARKQIERDMERFKVCEKETKTKAFSKEALTNTPKKKLLDKPKLEIKAWIDRRVSLLKGQLSERESQLDAEQRRGKKRNKGHEEVHVDHLQKLVERYKFHIEHLEMAWEMLFEDEIVVSDIEEIQEDVDYFIENNQDEDMEDFDDAYMYDLLSQKRNAKPPPPPVVFPVDEDEEGSDFDLGTDDDDDDDYDSLLDEDDDEKFGDDDHDDNEEAASSTQARRNTAKRTPAPAATPPPTTIERQARRSICSTTSSSDGVSASDSSKDAKRASANAKAAVETPKKAAKKKKEKPVAAIPIQVSANYQEIQQPVASRPSPSSSMTTQSPKHSPRAAVPAPRVVESIPLAAPPAPFANIVKQQQQKQQAEQAAAFAKLQAQRDHEAAIAAAQQKFEEEQLIQRQQQQQLLLQQQQEQQKALEQQAAAQAAAAVAAAAALAAQQREQALATEAASLAAAAASAQLLQQQMLQQQQQTPDLAMKFHHSLHVGSSAPPPGIRAASPMSSQAPPPGLGAPPPSKTTLANKLRQKQHQGAAASEEPAADLSLVRPGRLAAQQAATRDASPAVQPQTFDAPLSDEQKRNLEIMEASLRHMPSMVDSDRPKHYLPRNPYHTPASWPSSPSPIFEEPSFFEKYDTDTLFFIFYFQQGTYQQYLAASQLKKQSWRYHTKYLTWFQRHKDPQVTTDEYEQGTYVYFDYDHSWCQRIKSDFTFAYKFLEDDL